MGQKRSTLQKEHSLFISAQAKQGEKKLYVLSFYMIIVRGCAMCWWKISNECSLCMRDLPHTYFCTYLYSNKKKTKVETNMGSTDLNIGEPKSFYYHYYYYYYCYNYYYCLFITLFINNIIFYFICSPNFFSITQSWLR
jgi:hypothetical protein